MSLLIVTPGSNFLAEAFFYNSNGTPFNAKRGVVFEVRSPTGLLVVNGEGNQDLSKPGRWYASISLPENLAECDGKYRLTWFANGGKETKAYTEAFSVKEHDDALNAVTDRIFVKGGLVYDEIYIAEYLDVDIEHIAASIVDAQGHRSTPVNPESLEYSRTECGFDVFTFESDALRRASHSCNSGNPLIVEWVVQPPNSPPFTEYHFLYMLSPMSASMLNDLRRYIDKAQNQDILPALQLTEIDLLHYLKMGLHHFNAKPPSLTSYTLDLLPDVANYAILQCAAYEALRAQTLAEGLLGFDFGGQSVTLNIDKTQAYETELGRLQNYLDNDLPKVKGILAKKGSPGVLNISIHRLTNFLTDETRALEFVTRRRGSYSLFRNR